MIPVANKSFASAHTSNQSYAQSHMSSNSLPMKRMVTWLMLAIAVTFVSSLLSMQSAHARTLFLPDFASLVEKVGPSVVNISTTQKVQQQGMGDFNIPEGHPLHDLFRDFMPPQQQRPREYEAQSLGSGFILSEDGLIMTNHHVVDGASEIIVKLQDRRQMVAELIGSDPSSDVAILKIEATDLPAVKIGNSDQLRVGEWVMAIGSPLGFEYSVTSGIVSAKGRTFGSDDRYVPFIQTDVAINPGNSGGPLFNLDGEVIGVNSRISTRSGGYMGLSFAIPMNLAMNVSKQLQGDGVKRGWLGVSLQEIDRDLAEALGLDKPEGALVNEVFPDSPADQAGFEAGDVILQFNGRSIADVGSLPPMVGATPIGDSVPVQIVRNRQAKALTVTIGELDSDNASMPSRNRSSDAKKLGIRIQSLTPQQRAELSLAEGGIVVSAVSEGGLAANAGIEPGDILLELNMQPIQSVQQFSQLVKELPTDRSMPLLIIRGRQQIYRALKIPSDQE